MRWVRDQRVLLLEPIYLEAEKKTAYYLGRGYWRAATKWADLAAVVYVAMNEVGWVKDGEPADA